MARGMCRWTELLRRSSLVIVALAAGAACVSAIVLQFISAATTLSEGTSAPSVAPQATLVPGVEHHPLQAELKALTAQNEALSLQLAQLQRQVDALQRNSMGGSYAPLAEQAQEGPERLGQVDAQEAQIAARTEGARDEFMLLEEQFYAEPLDPQWAATMQRDFHGIEARLIEHTHGGTYIEYQECRSSTCRVQFTHDSRAPALLPALIASPNNAHVVLQSVSEDGVEKTIALYSQ